MLRYSYVTVHLTVVLGYKMLMKMLTPRCNETNVQEPRAVYKYSENQGDTRLADMCIWNYKIESISLY